MKLAAKSVAADWMESGKMKTATQTAEEKKAAKESERQARIAAQGAGKSAPAAPDSSEEDDELTAQEKHICERMGISEEAYKKRAKQGVNLQWRPGR